MSDILLHEVKGKSEIITFNNPDKLNVLSDEMLGLLLNALEKASLNSKTKVVIIKSTGKAFCAGHDLKQMQNARTAQDKGISYFKDLFKRCSKIMIKINNLSKPVIAEVQGIATAAGCQLVATCDIAVASKNARFGVNGVNIGLFCSTPMVALSRNISRKKTFEMLVTGDFLNADEAKDAGLINHVTEERELSNKTNEIALKIAEKYKRVVKIGKKAFYNQAEMNLEKAYEYTANIMVENMIYEETNEGISAFIEKRIPEWSD
ncbi:MAG: enoyl-CoA hydratase [Paracoccaceae bacterium]